MAACRSGMNCLRWLGNESTSRGDWVFLPLFPLLFQQDWRSRCVQPFGLAAQHPFPPRGSPVP